MEPMRILHIVHTLNRGGMESRIMDMYRNLDRTKIQYDFYIESGENGLFDAEVKSLGGRLFYSKKQFGPNIPNFGRFRNFILNHPEIKVVFAYNQWAGFYLKQAKKAGVLYRIAGSMTSLQTVSIKNGLKNLVKKNVNKYANYRFAVSQKAAYWLFGEEATNSEDVHIWPNAIDTMKYAFSDSIRNEMRDKLGLEDAYVIMHVGNIRFEKNHAYLLQIFAEIKKTHKNAKLVLAGGGDFASLKPDVDKLGICEDVIHLGVRSDVPQLLQAADAFVFPSLYEGFPGAVLEAEAAGANCLISDSITDEVLLTTNIKSMSLAEPPIKWANALDSITSVDRHESWKVIKDAGYDVNDLVRKQDELVEWCLKEESN